LASLGDQTPAQRGDLLVDGVPSPEQGFSDLVQRTIGDQAADLFGEGLANSLAGEQAEWLEQAADLVAKIDPLRICSQTGRAIRC
jgi:hypothetical protein